MNIRKLQTKDSPLLLNLLCQLDRETKFMIYEPHERKTSSKELSDSIKKIIDNGGVIFGAELSDELVGVLFAHRENINRIKHCVYLVIGVLQKASGQGIATKLLKAIENWAFENKIFRLELTVMVNNHRAIRLYERSGFEKEGIKRNSLVIDNAVVDEYYMGKILKLYNF